MSAIELVVTDLDRTLWHADERIHDRTLEALRELRRRRFPVLVATGRRHRSAVEGLARSSLRFPAVVLDGAMGRDHDGRTFHDAAFTPAQAQRVLAAFLAAGLEPALYVDAPGMELVVGDAPSTHRLHIDHVGDAVHRGDLSETVARRPVYSFAVVAGDAERIDAAAAGILHAGNGTRPDGHPWVSRDAFLPGTSTISVRPPGVSKWAGVLAWCADQGLDPTAVLAVGDGENDIELLEAARVSCVVSDGCDAALALADHVIEPACDGGWGGILDLIG